MGDVNANDIVAFLVEVVAFVSLGIWGWQLGSGGPLLHKWIGLIAVLVVAVALWALFVSPQSVFDVPVLEVVLRIVILGAGWWRSASSPISAGASPSVWSPR